MIFRGVSLQITYNNKNALESQVFLVFVPKVKKQELK
jgi:hypothetical protein